MTATGLGAAFSLPDVAASVDGPPPRRARVRKPGAAGRWIILAVAAVYFIGPLLAAISFTLQGNNGGISFSAYRDVFTANATGQVTFSKAVVYSLEIAVVTIALTLALMMPTQLLLHLRFPRVRGIVEVITLLPLVFPPIVLVVGVRDVYTNLHAGPVRSVLQFINDPAHPLLLVFLYVMLSMPFVFRTLDAGIRSVDIRVLVEAARNLGASWPTVVLRVLLPSLRSAVVNSAFLCFALVMGEFTIAQILNYTKPFPVWLYQLPTNSGRVQAAVSVFSLALVEVLLLVIGALNWRSTRKIG